MIGNKEFVTDFRSLLDKKRFEEQIIDGQSGFYDKIEEVFIPENVFATLFNNIGPRYQPSNIEIQNMIQSSRKRVSNTIKDIHQNTKDSYAQIFLSYLSHKFLLENKKQPRDMVILYIDLVGSTALTAILNPEELSMIVRIFCQEISICISRYFGYVLKYAGDAVIGYFPEGSILSKGDLHEHAIKCGFYMQKLLDESVNEILYQNKYPKLRSRIAIDVGRNQIVVLGSEPDLLGHVISRAAKIMGKAPPNNIIIGENVFRNLNDNTKEKFPLQDKFMLFETGEIYSTHMTNKKK
ncbi:MAG TPA: adenylate/guanylate cyclase domain-containing protein [Nitrososphaeraceae archaeon]|nr:adenylate/guanylate cyclase domain-containing protein [Nitrososphaeraceae archaeon]HSF51215.1 adenylate/guanylate cyclase domain-containing protein [Nitrososphaeraceae archaeon]